MDERPTMLAARYSGPGSVLTLERIPVPEPGPGEALLRVLAAGVCHTELQLLAGTLNLGVAPLTLGHEVVGEIVALGEQTSGAVHILPGTGGHAGPEGGHAGPEGGHAGPPLPVGADLRVRPASQGNREAHPQTDGLELGTRALVYYYTPCDECAWCRAGEEQLCPNLGPQIGFSADGGFAEYVRVASRNLVPLPPDLESDVAAPLGCSAGAALHAVRAVAQVQPGETALVYGIGAVGLALVQLACLAGARVLAVGRSPAKLDLARELGADVTIQAGACDVVAEALRATRSEGVDVLFEAVGSAETMANSLAMLRRRGRLVFVGYGADRLQVNPLHLVLKELQVRGSLGNTRAELREVVALAAEGRLRSVVSARRPLGEVNQALEALRRGEAVGRIVLEPALTAAKLPLGERPLERELLAFVARGLDGPKDDREFDALALRLFAYQFERNAPYRAFCQRRGRTPETVAHWREVPAVPISAFKEAVLACEPIDGAREFNSSGTTRPERKSRHYHPSLAVYDLNATLNFEAHVLPDGARLPMAVLFPRPEQMPNSSLAYWLAMMVERFSADGGRWFVGPDGLDSLALAAALRALEREGQPVCLLAASFALVHFLDHCAAEGLRFSLPPGSRLMDTGGYKGRSRELPQRELYGLATELLGIPQHHSVSMYGMTEHSTQFLDAVLRNHIRDEEAPRYKTVPPWARTEALDPDTLAPMPRGELGLLCHYDLANRASVMAVLSEDVGYEVGPGFELVGRLQGTETRGCSIAVDELIAAARGA